MAAQTAIVPRDPVARTWYRERLQELVRMEPPLDGVVIESPYHDGVACQCAQCSTEPYPEDQMLAEMYAAVREARPDLPIVRCIKHNITDAGVGEALAAQLKTLEGPGDWYMNTYPNRASRQQWHALGPRFATYLLPYREVLKGNNVPEEIEALYAHFNDAASRGVMAHGFCYRFYGGRMGSYKVSEDAALRARYPDRRGAFSMALVAEAAFDPSLSDAERAHRVRRIQALTIPDYPRNRALADAEVASLGREPAPQTAAGPVIADPASYPPPGRLLRMQYSIQEPGFLMAQVCADVDNDGAREVVYASRGTGYTHLLRASDGTAKWGGKIPGDHQSIMAYDLDSDGTLEIVYTTSGPGRAYVLDGATGDTRRTWDAGDWKAGHSPVIIDADGDGVLDGYLGTRSTTLARLNMRDLTPIATRGPWSQCGCYPSALDVDGDGRWDLFAGSGDDSSAKGVAYRYDPITLEPVWQFATNDNASSADMVLADIDGDGQVEIVKSVDNYANDDAHDAIHAWETDGAHLWSTTGLSGEDSPNVADLDGDGEIEIIGMTFCSEVYCLNADGSVRWRKDLRPELDNTAHAYMTPVLCDMNGKPGLEIVAFTNDGYFANENEAAAKANGIIFVLDATGHVLDQYDVGAPRYWGTAFACNADGDPWLELCASGSGGFDVLETRGYGPDTEHFQRRRTYQRLNVLPWAYEDTYFNYRGVKENVVPRADSLVLARDGDGYVTSGSYTTALMTLPPGMSFGTLVFDVEEPAGTAIRAQVLDLSGAVSHDDVKYGTELGINVPIRLRFAFSTSENRVSPLLDAYALSFGQ